MDVVNRRLIHKYDHETIREVEDLVIKEYPFTILLNGQKLITLLCTPRGLDYLSIGFLLSEGLIQKKEDIISLEIDEEKGIAKIETKKRERISGELTEKRTVTTGACKGTVFYDVMDFFEYQRIDSPLKVHIEDILELVRKFSQASDLFLNTGGVHSTGIAAQKEILLFHEDVGRHNALDKVIGESFMKDMVLKDKMIITSGRISSEMLIKCAKREIPILISRTAPTDLALQLGEKIGMTIIGFARGLRLNIYTEPQRICMK